MITANVDAAKALLNLNRMQHNLPNADFNSLLDVAYEVIRLSNFQVPHDKGTLQNSATVQKIGRVVMAGYNMVYAARLHEHPEYHFQKGRKGKYLEDPINENTDVLGLTYVKKMSQEITK